jgi:hypothetical protein
MLLHFGGFHWKILLLCLVFCYNLPLLNQGSVTMMELLKRECDISMHLLCLPKWRCRCVALSLDNCIVCFLLVNFVFKFVLVFFSSFECGGLRL